MLFEYPDGRTTLIPNYPGEDIDNGLLNKIIKKDLQMEREEFLKSDCKLNKRLEDITKETKLFVFEEFEANPSYSFWRWQYDVPTFATRARVCA